MKTDPGLRVFEDEAPLVEALAGEIATEAASVLLRRTRFTLVLAGGTTPRRLYARLAQPPFKTRIPWDKVHLFMGDERYVPPHHAGSNYRMVRESLLEHVPLPPSHMHPVPTQTENARISAMEYERELRFFFNASEFPRFDLVLLGVGEDGHTASLFPGSPALEETKSWVAVSRSAVLPHERVTLTFPAINNARRIVFVATGARKDAILREILSCPEKGYPAQRVKPVDGKMEWWTDRRLA